MAIFGKRGAATGRAPERRALAMTLIGVAAVRTECTTLGSDPALSAPWRVPVVPCGRPAPAGEEGGEEGARLVGQHAVRDVDGVVQSGVGAQVVQRPAGARLGVGGAEHDASHPGGDQRTGAHGARFQGHDEGERVEPPRPQRPGGVAERQHLGVGHRVAGPLPLVVAAGHDLAVQQGHGTHGDVAVPGSEGGLVQGQPHRLLVGHGARP